MEDERETADTVKLLAVDPVQELLIQLRQGMRDGFTGVSARLDKQDEVLSTVSTEGVEANTRLSRLERRVEDLEGRISRNSDRARAASDMDLSHEVQLAEERAAREALAAQVVNLHESQAIQLAILTRLDSISKNPLVKVLGGMLLTAVIAWLASHGVTVK